ncbi:glycoside hydrolase family 2 protein [Babjeviella inositovora NRRL Y-12698]|uniref:beta-mannosidase n=1 Tax=Babjeviella inositovora NRRL Y-12698 TaxID=984486 RepID=A0A1E3R0C2_9ASCO|nr:glycoside hydrolase family 2 protein [Babjeviella inositovora NRRL Y-12698]ODQ83254.1 glycoside hydrolase family 2 protein [Babjeviella inositovora NRRL Y-12698]
MNEKEVQWVAEKDWEYRSLFAVTADAQSFAHHQFVFKSLDTFALVYLNGELILEADNMFREYAVTVKPGQIKFGGENEMLIHFQSALLVSRSIEKKRGIAKAFNGETNRVYVRKAQYHYGWDWGPVLNTCGPCRPILFHSYDLRLGNIFVKPLVDDLTASKVEVEVEVELLGNAGGSVKIDVLSYDNSTGVIGDLITTMSSNSTVTTLSVKNPKFWFPVGYGNQDRYAFRVTLLYGSVEIETSTQLVGLRKVELVQETFADLPGSSFYLKVNNIPVYCAGSNWIPAHSFSTKLTNRDYTDWLEIMINGNQNMIRVWAGGYYETDWFYEECDRLGLLVWQDFMFACGQYPGDLEFIALVSLEVESQLKRLRNHCSLAIFAGNNEDYQVAEQFKLEWDPSDNSGDYSNTTFPARTIYEVILPKLMAQYLPDVPYHPGSPFGGSHSADPTIGDAHVWDIWHGAQLPYQDAPSLSARFVSEFGMEALCSLKTYRECITDISELYPQSETVCHHNKADGFERRLALYVMENIKVTSLDLESWIYATQLMQAECLSFVYKSWRRNWKRDGERFTGGTLVWQINDCWPVASWAIVDFYKRPKLAYYAVKRESARLTLGSYRTEVVEGTVTRVSEEAPPHDYAPKVYDLDIWGVNASVGVVEGILKTDVYNITTGEKLFSLDDRAVSLAENGCTDLVIKLRLPDMPVVINSILVSRESPSVVLSRSSDWPQPLKFLKFPKTNIKMIVSQGKVELSSDKPIKGVEIVLDDLETEIFLSDNGVDLFPGETRIIEAKGLKGDEKLRVRYYK